LDAEGVSNRHRGERIDFLDAEKSNFTGRSGVGLSTVQPLNIIDAKVATNGYEII
jgi:hypothetical protein